MFLSWKKDTRNANQKSFVESVKQEEPVQRVVDEKSFTKPNQKNIFEDMFEEESIEEDIEEKEGLEEDALDEEDMEEALAEEDLEEEELPEGMEEAPVQMKCIQLSIGKGRKRKTTRGHRKVSRVFKAAFSTLDQRLRYVPRADSVHGKWKGKRGFSRFISKDKRVIDHLKKRKRDGVDYNNGMPDFTPFAKETVVIKDMTDNRNHNFAQADEIVAERWGKTKSVVAKWRRDNKYTWHELNDMKTMQLVPSIINNPIFTHLGGVGEFKIKTGKSH
ncbi:HNH endonuclease signature motif containing protein [Anaeromicropila populeti]|uniref:A nuclease of the HNH/ENDO VII superfamily with conserved WHH n=1 Tax=Anaeromicropila populeti TaxID=37658 RepID=A0A1I6JHU8_9FIRM|nr:HNH endonuclease [Anaeromicropila populeti]SFR78454.1 A nuclease of the HNH/ENDO VII superfamily with conserved WHH [Anaeromicropila populeti]